MTVVATGLSRQASSPHGAAAAGAAHRHRQRADDVGRASVTARTMASASADAPADGMKQPAVWRREQASEQVQACSQRRRDLRHPGLPAQAGRLSRRTLNCRLTTGAP